MKTTSAHQNTTDNKSLVESLKEQRKTLQQQIDSLNQAIISLDNSISYLETGKSLAESNKENRPKINWTKGILEVLEKNNSPHGLTTHEILLEMGLDYKTNIDVWGDYIISASGTLVRLAKKEGRVNKTSEKGVKGNYWKIKPLAVQIVISASEPVNQTNKKID